MENTRKIILDSKAEIITAVSLELSKLYGEIDDYEIAWKQLQDISAKAVIKLLKPKLHIDTIFKIPRSKSTYPDIKVINKDGVFAIDIKVNESSKDPWFDMARIDTIHEARLDVYDEEFELVIKYDSTSKFFICCYFLLFREVVGIRPQCNGIKYRPYDGKVRPKSWSDFDNNIVHWDSDEKFIEGIKRSAINRWKNNINNHLVKLLDDDEREEFKKLFE